MTDFHFMPLIISDFKVPGYNGYNKIILREAGKK